MPGIQFNSERWPEEGPHRELLEVLHLVHTRNGLRSLRAIGRDMNLAYTQVHKIVRGEALPVDERQVRDLVHAIAGRRDDEINAHADSAVGRWRAAVAAAAPRRQAAVPADPEPALSVGGSATDRPVGRPQWVLPVAVAAVLALAAGVAAVIGNWPPSGPTPEGATTRTDGGTVLADDFDGSELDPLVWNRPERPDVVTVRDGALQFAVDAEDTADGLHTEFAPRISGAFTEVSFVARVPAYQQAGPGGLALIVTESGGRNHRLIVGPSNGGPETAALFCDRDFCGQFDDYVPPSVYVPFEVGEAVPVRLAASGGRLNFYVRDRLVQQSPPVTNALTSFYFDVYGADGEAWNITVDSLSVIG